MSKRGRHRRAGKPQGQPTTGPAETTPARPLTLMEWVAKSPHSLVTRQQLLSFVSTATAPLVRAMGLDRAEEENSEAALKEEFEQGEAADDVLIIGPKPDATLHDRLDREHAHADPEE